MSTYATATTADTENIVRVGHLLLATLAPLPGDHGSPGYEAKKRSCNEIVAQGLAIIDGLHQAYNNVSAISDVSEYGDGKSAFPMTRLDEARIRAVTDAIHVLPDDDQLFLFYFFDALPPEANKHDWLTDNALQIEKKVFSVAPQAWVIRAGSERIGEIMGEPHGHPNLYHALSHRDDLWQNKEKNNQLALNGMSWLGTMIEKWGWDFRTFVVEKRTRICM
jgi:hypothetical protein